MTTKPSREPTDAERKIAVACTQLAIARQARDVKLLYVADRLGIADYFVLATVNNRRHARAVRDAVRVGLKKLGFGVPVKASEDPDGRWSLYDYGGVVLHLFDDEGRLYYDLDSLWAGVPVIEVEELPPGALDPGPEPEPDGDDV